MPMPVLPKPPIYRSPPSHDPLGQKIPSEYLPPIVTPETNLVYDVWGDYTDLNQLDYTVERSHWKDWRLTWQIKAENSYTMWRLLGIFGTPTVSPDLWIFDRNFDGRVARNTLYAFAYAHGNALAYEILLLHFPPFDPEAARDAIRKLRDL